MVSPAAPTEDGSSSIINWQVLRSSILVIVLTVSIAGTAGSTLAATDYTHELTLLHLLAFASWFGTSIWVSFVSGIIMFHNLPRHAFGRLMSKLFPAYFVFSAICTIIAIASAVALGWGARGLASILATILANVVYFEPATTRVMVLRHAVERRLGTGHEVGQLGPSDPAKASDPELRMLSKRFGVLHGASTSLNLAALGIGCYWLNFIAGQIVVDHGQ